MDEKLVDFLESLEWPEVNNRVLSYPADYKMLIKGFRNLLCNDVDYNIDKIRQWLIFHKPENCLEDNVIEHIVDMAMYVQIDYFPFGIKR